jgi:hypothetical protein
MLGDTTETLKFSKIFKIGLHRWYLFGDFSVNIYRITRPEREQVMVYQTPDARYQTHALKSGGSFARLPITTRQPNEAP